MLEVKDEDKINGNFYVSKDLIDKIDKCHIYKYMDFDYLVQLIEKCELFVPNRQRFTDLREHSESFIKSLEELKNKFSIVPNYKSRSFFKSQKERYAQVWYQAVSCWTYDAHRYDSNGHEMDENYLMWKCHSSKHFVCRIRSTVQSFFSCLTSLKHDILVSDVKYEPVIFFHEANNPSRIFVKPEFYIDEQEIRFVVLQGFSECSCLDDIRLTINPHILIDEITLPPFINHEEERILKQRLCTVMGENKIHIKSSMLMEYTV